jgi:hypothetical protein
MAEVRADPGALQASLARMTVVVDGASQDLAFNQATGTFVASLFLTVGQHVVVGRAFAADDALIGESHPVAVQITTGAVTRIELRVLDLTGGTPSVFGPLFDSLTFPTSTQAQQSASFALSVIAPAGDPVSYAWTSDCSDSVFSAPGAATTGWTKPSAGSCTVNVAASSNGFTLVRSFQIVVFPPGSGDGAADVSATFILAPQLFTNLANCGVVAGNDSSCQAEITAPSVAPVSVGVFSWGGSSPGSFEVSDDCGGSVGLDTQFPDFVSGFWLPPVAGGLCILTVRAISADGVIGKMSIAVLTRPGTAPPIPPVPQMFASGGNCTLVPTGAPPPDCGAFAAGAQRTVNASVSLTGGHFGSAVVIDSCAGTFPVRPSPGLGQMVGTWTVPGAAPGTMCLTKLRVTTLEGSVGELHAKYRLQ